MDTLSATRLPENTEKLKLPNVTFLPKAEESCVSSVPTKSIRVDEQGCKQTGQQQQNHDGDEDAYQRTLLHSDTSRYIDAGVQRWAVASSW